jgi:hypothetical protein
MGMDYGAVADRLLKMAARMEKERRRKPLAPRPRLDAFAMKACIDSLQGDLSKVEALTTALKAAA